jgi:hypothetical protein
MVKYANFSSPRTGTGSGPKRQHLEPDPTKKVRIRSGPDPQHWFR